MNLNNEFSFINSIKSHVKLNSYIGIGDDCSAQIVKNDKLLLTTTDLLIEQVHFKLDTISAYNLGRKSVEVNISDIAAMGGYPDNIHISLAIPKKLKSNYISDFYAGLFEVLNKYNIKLLGGDTSSSKNDFVINITVQGYVNKDKIKVRSSAQAGDYIVLNAPIGDSALGLNMLLNNVNNPYATDLVNAHNQPTAHITEGQFLASYSGVNAMIDLSDGLMKDLKHILMASNKGATIHLDKVPLSENYLSSYDLFSKNKYEYAISGGEDYSLLFTVAPEQHKEIESSYFSHFKKKLYIVGEITPGHSLSFYLNNIKKNINFIGFDHLTNNYKESNENS